MTDLWREAIERNYDVFRRTVSSYLGEHDGEYALLHNGELKGFFTSPGLAKAAGRAQFSGEPFSIQPVIDEPIDMGYFSHASR